VVERLRAGDAIRFGDAQREIVPRNDRLDGCIGIAAGLLRIQQGVADF
jgi:hypothetical protein